MYRPGHGNAECPVAGPSWRRAGGRSGVLVFASVQPFVSWRHRRRRHQADLGIDLPDRFVWRIQRFAVCTTHCGGPGACTAGFAPHYHEGKYRFCAFFLSWVADYSFLGKFLIIPMRCLLGQVRQLSRRNGYETNTFGCHCLADRYVCL